MRPVRVVTRITLAVGGVAVIFLTAGCPRVPEARIAGSIRQGEAPLTVEFHDISWPQGAAIVSWEWAFGDGATSTEQHPVHVYTAPGYHTVTLTVTNANGADTDVQTDYIHVLPVTLADGDRVGIVYGSVEPNGATPAADRTFKSTAVFLPGDLEQLTSMGYLAGNLNGRGLNIVDTLEPDTPVIMTSDEFETWLSGPLAPNGWPAIWQMAGLDAGEAGSTGAGAALALLPKWEDSGVEGFDDAPPPFTSGLYIQTGALTLPPATDSIALTWPGGADLGAIDIETDLPEPLTVLSPVAFTPPDSPPETQSMSKIPTSSALTVTWVSSGEESRYLQLYLFVSSWSWSGRETRVLLARTVDDGSFTVPASVMAALPSEPAYDRYEQRLMLSRLASADENVPLTGSGSGVLHVTTSTEMYVFEYSNE